MGKIVTCVTTTRTYLQIDGPWHIGICRSLAIHGLSLGWRREVIARGSLPILHLDEGWVR
jgi:hypothetical protein